MQPWTPGNKWTDGLKKVLKKKIVYRELYTNDEFLSDSEGRLENTLR